MELRARRSVRAPGLGARRRIHGARAGFRPAAAAILAQSSRNTRASSRLNVSRSPAARRRAISSAMFGLGRTWGEQYGPDRADLRGLQPCRDRRALEPALRAPQTGISPV